MDAQSWEILFINSGFLLGFTDENALIRSCVHLCELAEKGLVFLPCSPVLALNKPESKSFLSWGEELSKVEANLQQREKATMDILAEGACRAGRQCFFGKSASHLSWSSVFGLHNKVNAVACVYDPSFPGETRSRVRRLAQKVRRQLDWRTLFSSSLYKKISK